MGPYGTFDYTYDDVGNRQTIVQSGVTDVYAYLPNTNRIDTITGPNVTTFTYDANGNTTNITDMTNSRDLFYNQNNRLIRVEENSTILGEYIYNGLGQRIWKAVSGVTTTNFHYDFDGNIIAESDENGNFSKEYLYNGQNRLSMVDVATGERYDYGNDRLGTPQIMTDSNNNVVWEGVYKPFGEADVNPNSTVVNNFRFPGQYYDQETGLHYNGFRYYDSNIGRYITADPIGQDGGINLFLYALNNPINESDPMGLESGNDIIYLYQKLNKSVH